MGHDLMIFLSLFFRLGLGLFFPTEPICNA